MTDWRAWAQAWDNPVVDQGRAEFPFDRNAEVVFRSVPDGLIAPEPVLDDFLDPPSARGDWFSSEVWRAAAGELRDDDAVTADQYQDLLARFNRVQDSFEAWAASRPDMSKGYADTIPAEMRRAGANAWADLRNLTSGPLADISSSDDVGAETRRALDNLGQTLWSYVQCTAIELEASADGIAVHDIRDRVQNGIEAPWEPGVTPDNVDTGGVTTGAHRLPPLPKAPAEEGGDASRGSGVDPDRDPERDPGTEPGKDPGATSGPEPGPGPGTETDPGSGPESPPGIDPTLEPGGGLGLDPVGEHGFERGGGEFGR